MKCKGGRTKNNILILGFKGHEFLSYSWWSSLRSKEQSMCLLFLNCLDLVIFNYSYQWSDLLIPSSPLQKKNIQASSSCPSPSSSKNIQVSSYLSASEQSMYIVQTLYKIALNEFNECNECAVRQKSEPQNWRRKKINRVRSIAQYVHNSQKTQWTLKITCFCL